MALQFVLAALLFRLAGYYRPFMDADEGHFLSAIRCVHNGLAPCRDFFFQQTPLFPYPYAAAMKVFGYGYESCLWVSILFGAGLATVTAAYFSDRSGSRAIGWIGWLLIVANANILFWVPTVKNHAMPLFFGALAIWAASRRPSTARSAFAWSALAGFAALACVGSRLPAAPLSAVAGLWIVFRAIPPSRPRGAVLALLGFAVGMLPPAALILRSLLPEPWKFKYDIFGFHVTRSGSLGTYGTAETITAQLISVGRQIQFPLVLGLALLTTVTALIRPALRKLGWPRPTTPAEARPQKSKKQMQPIAAAPHELPAPGGPGLREVGLTVTALAAMALNVLPRQTFTQYFMVPLLLLILATAPLWARLPANGLSLAGLLLALATLAYVVPVGVQSAGSLSAATSAWLGFLIPFTTMLFIFIPVALLLVMRLSQARWFLLWRGLCLIFLIGYGAILLYPQPTRMVGMPFVRNPKSPEWTLNPIDLVRRLPGAAQEQVFDPVWDFKTVRQLSNLLRAETGPDDLVFSTWQGFTFLAGRRDLSGNENFNARTVSNQGRIPIDQLRQLHIAPNEDLLAALQQGTPKAIVIGFFADPFYLRELGIWDPHLRRSGWYKSDREWYVLRPEILARYHLVKQIKGAPPLIYTHQLWIRN